MAGVEGVRRAGRMDKGEENMDMERCCGMPVGSPPARHFSGGWLAALVALCCLVGGTAFGVDLKTALEGTTNGQTVKFSDHVSGDELDLDGTVIKITASNVTLEGEASHDLKVAVKAAATSTLSGIPSGDTIVLDRSAFDGTFTGLTATLRTQAPRTNIFNSAVLDSTDANAHGGISASQGGFSLKNMTFRGTTANIDAASGASKYMGLIASTFDRYTDAASATKNGLAQDGKGMGWLENVAFIDNVVNTQSWYNESTKKNMQVNSVGNTIFFTQRRYDENNVYTAPDRIETMQGIKGSTFIGNVSNNDTGPTSSVGNRDLSAAGVGWVYLKQLESSYFANNGVNGGHHAFGGGLFTYAVGSITDSVFYNNFVTSDHDAYGGAIYSTGIGSITGSVFVGNETRGLDFGQGRESGSLGGAINASGATNFTTPGFMDDPVDLKGIGTISNSLFAFNRAFNETGSEALGGAINVGRKLDLIENTTFYGNRAESNGEAFGGAISIAANPATAAVASLVTSEIKNSGFYNNSTQSEGLGGGGAIAINVAATPGSFKSTASPKGPIDPPLTDPNSSLGHAYTMTLSADANKATTFSGNTHNGQANSIYVGFFGEPAAERWGTVANADDNTKQTAEGVIQGRTRYHTDVTLEINAALNGKVELFDPIRVDILNDSRTFTLNNIGAGKFRWGGANIVNAHGGGAVNFGTGKDITLENNFSLASDNKSALAVDFGGGSEFKLVLAGRDKDQAMFQDIGVITNTAGTTVDYEYTGLVNKKESWLVATGAGAAGVLDSHFTSLSTDLTIKNVGGSVYAELDYKASADVAGKISAASKDVQQSINQIDAAFQTVLSGVDASQHQALQNELLGNLENVRPASSILAHADAAFGTNAGLVGQALMANNRSRASAAGAGPVAALSSGSGLASPVHGDYDSSYYMPGRFRVWADYVGTRVDQDRKDRLSGYDVKNNGAVFGGSFDLGCSWTLGGFFSYSDGNTDFDNVNAKIDSDIFQGGVFAQYRSVCSGWVASADLSFAHIDNDSVRYDIGGRHDASYDQNVFGAGMEVGYEFNPWCNGRLTPFAGMRYQHMRQDGVRESGGAMSWDLGSTNANSFASTLGVTLAHDFVTPSCVVTPSVTAAWKHEFGDRDVSTSVRYANVPNLVTDSTSMRRNRDSFEIGAAMSAMFIIKDDYSFGINGGYNATLSSHRVEHNFYGGVEFRF